MNDNYNSLELWNCLNKNKKQSRFYFYNFCLYHQRSTEALKVIEKLCCRQFWLKQHSGFSKMAARGGELGFFQDIHITND